MVKDKNGMSLKTLIHDVIECEPKKWISRFKKWTRIGMLGRFPVGLYGTEAISTSVI